MDKLYLNAKTYEVEDLGHVSSINKEDFWSILVDSFPR